MNVFLGKPPFIIKHWFSNRKPLCFTKTASSAQVVLKANGTTLATTVFQTSPTAEDGTWTDYSFGTTIQLTTNQKVYFRAKFDNSSFTRSTGNYLSFGTFADTFGVAVSGNIMSMLSPNYQNLQSLPDYAFYKMFSNTGITSCKGLNLPAKVLSKGCYSNLFYFSASESYATLTDGSLTIGAEELADMCFENMFWKQYKMVIGPDKILATDFNKERCCNGMFNLCKKMKSAPTMVVNSVGSYSLSQMFDSCESLQYVNITLNASELVEEGCYDSMFSGCKSLITAPTITNTTKVSKYSMTNMFNGCESLISAPNLTATEIAQECYSNMFYGCKQLAQVQARLPAMILAKNCYSGMFQNCSSITQAPSLPATTLAEYCYSNMFYGCRSLKVNENSETGEIILNIPAGTTGPNKWNSRMFSSTSGTFTGEPIIGNTYRVYQ